MENKEQAKERREREASRWVLAQDQTVWEGYSPEDSHVAGAEYEAPISRKAGMEKAANLVCQECAAGIAFLERSEFIEDEVPWMHVAWVDERTEGPALCMAFPIHKAIEAGAHMEEE